MQRFPWLPPGTAVHLQALRDFLFCRILGEKNPKNYSSPLAFFFFYLNYTAGRLRFIPGGFKILLQKRNFKTLVCWTERRGREGGMLKRKVLPPSEVHCSFLWLGWGPGRLEYPSSQPSISQCLRLGMVCLGVSVIFHCSTRTAFVPLAAFLLASPLSVWHSHKPFWATHPSLPHQRLPWGSCPFCPDQTLIYSRSQPPW